MNHKTMRAVVYACVLLAAHAAHAQLQRRLGNFREVFVWRQMTFEINGLTLLRDRFASDGLETVLEEERDKRQADQVFFNNHDGEPERNWNQRPNVNTRPNATTSRPVSPNDEAGRFFVQYNNVPMGMERVGNRLFVSLPRRRHGIPTTLNYIDLTRHLNTRSPPLTPYPDLRRGRQLTSVYRTRADSCGRLWMVDTGLLELPNNPEQQQPPAIVVFDLNTDSQILRYQFKSSDLPAANTPTGLASITVDIVNGDCSNAFAYVPDLTTFGIIVFSLRERDSWRLRHNYFSFNPTAGNLEIAGHRFQWSDGIFSITLNNPDTSGCRTAYFHPLISTEEFSVNTCVLRNRTASSDSDYYQRYSVVGNRGEHSQCTIHGYHSASNVIFFADIGRNAVSFWIDVVGNRGEHSQCTMHGYHSASNVIFFADIGRNAVSCWKTSNALNPGNVAVLAQDSTRMSYPSDLHVTDDEVWVMANTLPRFGYSRLDPSQYNFFIYRGNVNDLISGTVCDGRTPFAG